MNDFLAGREADNDFNKARFRDKILKLLYVLTPERHELLSLNYVKGLVKPKSQKYKGMKAVSISLIVGSEGRYHDFDNAFLPRYEHLRKRWINIDKAHLKDIILPPIKLYEIGGVYFVTDGNHRVSVARLQGVMTIDAEVISLDSEIKLKPRMTKSDLRNSVIEYEKKKFFKEIKISTIIKPEELEFTATGSYNEIIQHINCHKYYLNESKTYEIGFEEAVKSWYENLFLPIVNTINDEKLLSRFPGRTNADLYIWIIKHWDDLKRKYGKNIHIKDAVLNYSEEFGKGFKQQFFEFIKKVFFRFFKTNQK